MGGHYHNHPTIMTNQVYFSLDLWQHRLKNAINFLALFLNFKPLVTGFYTFLR